MAPGGSGDSPSGAVDRRRLLLGAGGLALATGAAGATAGRLTAASPTNVELVTGENSPWQYLPVGADLAAAVRGGARLIQLGPGDYPVRDTVVLPRGGQLRGVGQSTRIIAATTMDAVIGIGTGGPVDGVDVSSLVVDCDNTARVGIAVQISGRRGHYQDEPDPVIRLDDLWVYDAAVDGVVYQGTDVRSCTTSRVRVRRARRHGFLIEASDCWWIACEATTSTRGSGNAGFHVAGANNFFEACKAWFCSDYGWHIRGTRNKFIGCESQDTRSHGWFVEFDRNTYVGCVADTAGMFEVGGTPDTADGFHIVVADDSSFVGCQAFDRRPSGRPAQQRWGFRVPRQVIDEGRLVGASGWDNIRGLTGT